MSHRSYEDLKVWQDAMELAKAVYLVTMQLPKEETYGLSQQLRRCAVSVPSNIAEGAGRNNYNEFYQFLGVASGSLAELKTQLLIASDIFVAIKDPVTPLLTIIDEIGRMLSGLKKSIHAKRLVTSNQ